MACVPLTLMAIAGNYRNLLLHLATYTTHLCCGGCSNCYCYKQLFIIFFLSANTMHSNGCKHTNLCPMRIAEKMIVFEKNSTSSKSFRIFFILNLKFSHMYYRIHVLITATVMRGYEKSWFLWKHRICALSFRLSAYELWSWPYRNIFDKEIRAHRPTPLPKHAWP